LSKRPRPGRSPRAEPGSQFTLLETIVETAPSLLVNVGTDGRILDYNKAFEEATGLGGPEEIRGRFFWDVFIDPDEREAMTARFEAAAPDFPQSEYESVFTNARGERRAIAWKSAPVTDDQGEVVSIVAGGLDITDRHRQAEELERERSFLNAIANSAPSLLCLIDDRGLVQDRATNIAFERLLGYEPEETGAHIFWERYVAPSDIEDVRAEIERVIAGGDPQEVDSRWVTKRGRRIVVAWSCTPGARGADERSPASRRDRLLTRGDRRDRPRRAHHGLEPSGGGHLRLDGRRGPRHARAVRPTRAARGVRRPVRAGACRGGDLGLRDPPRT
jgi:PAS domain S-box-containing protein